MGLIAQTKKKWDYNSLLIPLLGTNSFLPGNETLFGAWINVKNAQLKDIMKEGDVCTIQELRHKGDLLLIDKLR